MNFYNPTEGPDERHSPSYIPRVFGHHAPVIDSLARRQPLASAANLPDPARFGVFMALWMIVGFVSAYDSYLTLKYCESLHVHELNPIGRWLMGLEWHKPSPDPAGTALFLACKFAGTVVVLGVLILLYRYRERMGLTVAGSLALFQLGLGMFLFFGR
jgi:hypothetical protein